MRNILNQLITQAQAQCDILQLLFELDGDLTSKPTSEFIRERLFLLKKTNDEPIKACAEILNDLFNLFDLLILNIDDSLYEQYIAKFNQLISLKNNVDATKH